MGQFRYRIAVWFMRFWGMFKGAKAAVFLGDQLLCLLRDDKADIPYPNHWDFPGGGREADEAPWETLAREVQEEVGLIILPEHVRWTAHFAEAEVWFYVLFLPQDSQPVLGDEGQRLGRFTPDEFLELPDAVPQLKMRLLAWRAHQDSRSNG